MTTSIPRENSFAIESAMINSTNLEELKSTIIKYAPPSTWEYFPVSFWKMLTQTTIYIEQMYIYRGHCKIRDYTFSRLHKNASALELAIGLTHAHRDRRFRTKDGELNKNGLTVCAYVYMRIKEKHDILLEQDNALKEEIKKPGANVKTLAQEQSSVRYDIGLLNSTHFWEYIHKKPTKPVRAKEAGKTKHKTSIVETTTVTTVFKKTNPPSHIHKSDDPFEYWKTNP